MNKVLLTNRTFSLLKNNFKNVPKLNIFNIKNIQNKNFTTTTTQTNNLNNNIKNSHGNNNNNNDLNNKVLNITKRSNTCGDLNKNDIGKEVLIYGWINSFRKFGDQVFMVIRDGHGKVQVIINLNESNSNSKNIIKTILKSSVPNIDIDSNKSIEENIKLFKLESIVSIRGKVIGRPDDMINQKMKTGEIEIEASEIQLLNNCADLPFTVEHDGVLASEELRLTYRYVDLRRDQVQSNIRLRSRLSMAARNYLVGQDFIEVETPTLFRPTPEGAREYLVPTRNHGQFYSLPQSPQQYKQLLMVGGVDRYFQLARCYRDEDLRSDRQPEFTQIDMELSFVNCEMIYTIIEGLLKKLWKEAGFNIDYKFPFYTYEQVLSRYGIDKPDTRYALAEPSNSFKESKPMIKCIKLSKVLPTLSKSELEQLVNDSKFLVKEAPHGVVSVAINKKDGEWKSRISKFLSEKEKQQLVERMDIEDGDVLLIAAGPRCNVESLLGKVRIQSAQLLKKKKLLEIDDKQFNFLWVVDFPLFTPESYLNENSPLLSTHHPFTAPHPEDIDILLNENSKPSDYSKIRGLHYDIVLNGVEMGGGSIRIHNQDVQLKVLEKVLRLPPHLSNRFSHLINALAMGCPPHGDWFGLLPDINELPPFLSVLTFNNLIKHNDLQLFKPGSLPNSLTTLTLGHHFNQVITPGTLPNSLTTLTFSYYFNQVITPGTLPNSLKTLILSHKFNQVVTPGSFPNSLTTLTFGHDFNQVITPGTLPNSLTKLRLTFGHDFNQVITPGTLPNSLTTLTFGHDFNQVITPGTLPNSLTKLRLGGFNQVITPGTLPNSLTALTFYNRFKQEVKPGLLPKSLTTLTFGESFNQLITPGTLPNNLTTLTLGGFNRLNPGSLPNSLTTLTFGYYFNKVVKLGVLPNSLTTLTFRERFNQVVKLGSLPNSLTTLTFGSDFDQFYSTTITTTATATATATTTTTTNSKTIEVAQEKGKTEKLFIFVGNEPVSGKVSIALKEKTKKIEHTGIKVEFVGQIELFYDRGNHYEFTSLVRELAPAGELTENKEFTYDFLNVEKQYESYNGTNVRLRYFVRLTIGRSFGTNIVKEYDIWVINFEKPPEINSNIKMEVGIEDCLHIEFEYNKSKYHLKDVIIGKIYFLLVRIKIKYMEIALIKKESTGSGPNVFNESETLTKFEIMDGAPVRGESIPVRLFLSVFDLTPTYKSVHNKFSVKYSLNLALVDEDDKKYFKSQDIYLWRRPPTKSIENKPATTTTTTTTTTNTLE
ncbi:hypothetical protein DICPUDRAFT_159202 [Dictyostelium purpureum]|uniref:Aminoacyl-transfer RNA synthetases class-II family profile domain-containing protein n=1 Tax=Dictyostelium purpureum TaxID=5786 RepID=F1A3I9_DICPU|nr:uncharacterized protein DICPUDRAFT_159202 [Dictyostelium purpureum]EGC29242.1 hypothetical protein DICPUDRAFT_159202 [Dictyostelium purpureum]|eukprot:XP_003294234.1 hypothetical protein DICPUDRAFT_159202 [Dictyostelium purpureum]